VYLILYRKFVWNVLTNSLRLAFELLTTTLIPNLSQKLFCSFISWLCHHEKFGRVSVNRNRIVKHVGWFISIWSKKFGHTGVYVKRHLFGLWPEWDLSDWVFRKCVLWLEIVWRKSEPPPKKSIFVSGLQTAPRSLEIRVTRSACTWALKEMSSHSKLAHFLKWNNCHRKIIIEVVVQLLKGNLKNLQVS